MTKIALLAHGFNVSDRGVGTIGRLRFFLTTRGWDAVSFDMGWMGLVQVRTQNSKHAKKMAEAARNAKFRDPNTPVVAIGHSNGCCVIHKATTEHHAPIDGVVYINPALNRDAAPGGGVKVCHVWHSPSDPWVKVAKFLPAHDWGDMGAVGYKGDDPRVKNFNKEDLTVSSSTHSDFAVEEKITFFGPAITEKLDEVFTYLTPVDGGILADWVPEL